MKHVITDLLQHLNYVFKVLMANVDKLIVPMELTGGVLNIQFYGKVEEYKTLEYNGEIADYTNM